MKPHYFTMLGLALDVVGAFFVAVEAIKVENLKALREKVFRKVYRHSLPPRIYFVGGNQGAPATEEGDRPSEGYPGIFQALHYIAGFIVLCIADRLLAGRLSTWLVQASVWVWERPLWVSAPLFLLAGLFLVLGGLWGVGELVHQSITSGSRLAMSLIDFIEVRTPDGTIGMIGFALLVAGFGLQLFGAYIGAPR